MDKACAKEIRDHALKAIAELSHALIASENRCSAEEFEQVKRGVGLSIGKIQIELLGVVYKRYPELDDL